MHENSLQNESPIKQPKKLSKNRFWDAFWPPKPTQNPRKIVSKSMLTNHLKKKPFQDNGMPPPGIKPNTKLSKDKIQMMKWKKHNLTQQQGKGTHFLSKKEKENTIQTRRNGFEYGGEGKTPITFQPFVVQTSNLQF